MNYFRLLPLLPLLAVAPVLAQPASVVRDTELKSEPFSDAKSVLMLKARQQVDVSARKGGWYQTKSSDGKSGWVRLTTVLLDSTQGNGESGVASTARFLQSGRSGSTGVTAATGIRGLDSADVVNATPDTQAVENLDSLAVSSSEARSFAAKEHLTAKNIAYLPAGGK